MAYTYNTVKSLFTAICDAIRAKTGTSGDIDHQDIPDRISKIETNLEKDLYIDDGKTRMLIDVPDGGEFKFALVSTGNALIKVDWGDGTTTTTPDSQAQYGDALAHTYETGGQYMVTAESLGEAASTKYRFNPFLRLGSDKPYTEGRNNILGISYGTNFGAETNTSPQDRVELRTLVYILNDDIISHTSDIIFNGCRSLRHATVINDCESRTGTKFPKFTNCEYLANIEIPPVFTTIQSMSFYNNYSLAGVYIPPCITTIQSMAFENCYCLNSITLPESLVTLDRAFNQCSKLEAVIVTREDGITTAGSNLFESNTPISKGTGYIYVPDALLADYQAATNWTNYSAQMVPWSQAPDWVKGILVERGHTVS